MIDKLLLAADGSDRSLRAAAVAGELAGRLDAALTIVTVDDQQPLTESLKRFAEVEGLRRGQVFESVLESARECAANAGAGAIETRLLDGDPAEAILDAAARLDAKLIVMGSHGFSPVGELVMGGVSHAVTRGTGLPCVIAH